MSFYFPPISYPKTSLFNGKLEFVETLKPKTTLNRVLPYVASSVGYPLLVLVAAIYWAYLKYDSYQKTQHFKLVEHKWSYFRDCAPENLKVAVVLRQRKIRSKLLSITPVVHSIKRMLAIEGSLDSIELERIYSERKARIDQQPSGLDKEDKLAELETQIHILHTYERYKEESWAYEALQGSSEHLRVLFLQRIAFHNLRVKIALAINEHFLKNLKEALVPIVGVKHVLESSLTTKVELESQGLVTSYNQTISELIWLHPY